MWLLYAAAFLLGAGILLIQLLSGHHGHDVGAGHDVGTDGGGHHPSQGPGLMSIRSLSYGVFAFGFVGGALHVLGLAAPGVALAVGLGAGAAATLLVGLTFRQLGDPSVSGAAGFHEALGASGRVIVACARGRSGKVRVSLKGQSVDMLATTDEDEIPAGAEVVIAEVRDAVVHVTRARN
jgi:membrane protein implicated in regulation of membrane protease activity